MSTSRPLLWLVSLVLVVSTLTGCSNKPGNTETPKGVAQEKLETVDVSPYQAQLANVIEANFESFQESCRKLEGAELSELVAPDPARTGPMLIVYATKWEPSAMEKPEYQYAMFPDSKDQEPKCVALVYLADKVIGTSAKEAESAFSNDSEVKLARQAALGYVIDLETGTHLGTGYVLGEQPTKDAPRGTAPDLTALNKGPEINIGPLTQKVEEIGTAWKAGDEAKAKELLAALPATDEATADFFLNWSREANTAGVPDILEVALESLAQDDSGLQYTLRLSGPSTPKEEPGFYLKLHFNGESALTQVENVSEPSEMEAYLDKLIDSEAIQGETPRSVLEVVDVSREQKWNDKAMKLVDQILAGKFGELSPEQKKMAAQHKQSIIKEKAKRFAPEVEKLKDEALAYLKTKAPGKAIKVLKQAVTLDPTDDEVAFFLIRSYDENNDLAMAEKLAGEFKKKYPNSDYVSRISDIKSEIGKKKKRLSLGRDVTARYKVTGKPLVQVESYAQFYPSERSIMDQKMWEDIKQGRRARRYRYGVPNLRRGDELKIIKAVSYTKQGRSYYSSYRRYRKRQETVYDYAYVEVLSGSAKGEKGWIPLELVDYQDIGYASEPFALPLIFAEDAK